MNTQTETHCGSNTKTSDRKTCTLMGMKFTQRVVQKSVCVCGCGFVRESGNLARLAVDRSQLHVFILQHLSVPVSFLLLLTHTCTHTEQQQTLARCQHTCTLVSSCDRERRGVRGIKWGEVRGCATCDAQITHMDGTEWLADSASGNNLYLTVDPPHTPTHICIRKQTVCVCASLAVLVRIFHRLQSFSDPWCQPVCQFTSV